MLINQISIKTEIEKYVYLKGISIYMRYKKELTTTYVKQKYFSLCYRCE